MVGQISDVSCLVSVDHLMSLYVNLPQRETGVTSWLAYVMTFWLSYFGCFQWEWWLPAGYFMLAGCFPFWFQWFQYWFSSKHHKRKKRHGKKFRMKMDQSFKRPSQRSLKRKRYAFGHSVKKKKHRWVIELKRKKTWSSYPNYMECLEERKNEFLHCCGYDDIFQEHCDKIPDFLALFGTMDKFLRRVNQTIRDELPIMLPPKTNHSYVNAICENDDY